MLLIVEDIAVKTSVARRRPGMRLSHNWSIQDDTRIYIQDNTRQCKTVKTSVANRVESARVFLTTGLTSPATLPGRY